MDAMDPGAAQALGALREQILDAASQRRVLRLRGGDTKSFWGEPVDGEVLDTRAYAGIVSYEPTELVITARAGTPLVEIEDALERAGQMLAFEPPHFGEGATIGGTIACGVSGPRRASAGSARDFVLGAKMLDAGGDWLQFGGQVMKNVAGYDVSRLLCGSLGVLGLIAEVSLKVLPKPAAETSVRIAVGDPDEAVRLFNAWGGRPLPISATCWRSEELCVRFSGARAAVEDAVRRFDAEHGGRALAPDEAASFWSGVREHTDVFFDDDTPLWRLSVPSVAPWIDFPGRQLIEWGGALRWIKTSAPAASVRAAAANVGGSAMYIGRHPGGEPVFDPLPPIVAQIHRRLKQRFDPAGIFNAGRMYPGF
ncbi:MAG: glycolate oxidase subunit GlcE [Burkholderiaceae bacterium]